MTEKKVANHSQNGNENEKIDSNQDEGTLGSSLLSLYVSIYICYQCLTLDAFEKSMLSDGYNGFRTSLSYRNRARLFRIERNVKYGCQRLGYYSGFTRLRRSIRNKMANVPPSVRLSFNLGMLVLITHEYYKRGL